MIIPLIAFGVGLVGTGLFWHLMDDVLDTYIAKYVYNTADVSYVASDLVWQALPYIILVVGIICLVIGGFARSKKQQ